MAGNAKGKSTMLERSTMSVPLTIAVIDGDVSLIETLWAYVFGSKEKADDFSASVNSIQIEEQAYTAVYKDPRVLMDKEGSLAIDQGVKVYWDDTAKVITTTVSGNYLFGHCVTAALDTDAQVLIDFNGVNNVAEA